MNQASSFSIKSRVELEFKTAEIRDISYISFLPEFNKLQTRRSKIIMEKEKNFSLVFKVQSQDITAFRASMNEIISLGKIIDNTLKLAKKS